MASGPMSATFSAAALFRGRRRLLPSLGLAPAGTRAFFARTVDMAESLRASSFFAGVETWVEREKTSPKPEARYLGGERKDESQA